MSAHFFEVDSLLDEEEVELSQLLNEMAISTKRDRTKYFIKMIYIMNLNKKSYYY